MEDKRSTSDRQYTLAEVMIAVTVCAVVLGVSVWLCRWRGLVGTAAVFTFALPTLGIICLCLDREFWHKIGVVMMILGLICLVIAVMNNPSLL